MFSKLDIRDIFNTNEVSWEIVSDGRFEKTSKKFYNCHFYTTLVVGKKLK